MLVEPIYTGVHCIDNELVWDGSYNSATSNSRAAKD